MKFTILPWLVTILVPIALIGLGLRALLTPTFLQIEYNMPYFPPDELWLHQSRSFALGAVRVELSRQQRGYFLSRRFEIRGWKTTL